MLNGAPDPNAPPEMFTAIQEQLGLKLESTKRLGATPSPSGARASAESGSGVGFASLFPQVFQATAADKSAAL
jgi:hypothetical protein